MCSSSFTLQSTQQQLQNNNIMLNNQLQQAQRLNIAAQGQPQGLGQGQVQGLPQGNQNLGVQNMKVSSASICT